MSIAVVSIGTLRTRKRRPIDQAGVAKTEF